MKTENIKTILILTIAVILQINGYSQTPVEEHGLLRVKGARIIDKNEDTVSFSGTSLFWSNKGWGGEKYYNAKVVDYLVDNWHTSVIRACLGVDEEGGYLTYPNQQKKLITSVIDAAIRKGIYIIVDWHTYHAQRYTDSAISFFDTISKQYGKYDNIIYEIYNEPTKISWADSIKPYAEDVIETIRANDPDNLIIVGTPTWSQDVDIAAKDPISDTNVAYSLHFYAATHKQQLRDKAIKAMNDGIALFITEWGTCEASGNGAIDETSVEQWMNFCRKYSISNINWALNDKAEAASSLKPGASSNGEWTNNDLTESGLIVRNIINYWPREAPPIDTTMNKTSGTVTAAGLSDKINVYPVPFTNKLNISLPDDLIVKRIKILNFDGEEIMSLRPKFQKPGKIEEDIQNVGHLFLVKIFTSRGTVVKEVNR